MKPIFFETAAQLLNFLDRLPVPQGIVKGSDGEMIDAQEVMNRTRNLVPKMFRARDILTKQAGGFGNLKSLRRFDDIITTNSSSAAESEMNRALNALAEEIDELVNAGASEELASQISSAKTQLARFNLVKNSIEGHQTKLLERINAVKTAFSGMVVSITTAQKAVSNLSVKDELTRVLSKLEVDMDELDDVMKAVVEYNKLQVSFNSMMFAERAA